MRLNKRKFIQDLKNKSWDDRLTQDAASKKIGVSKATISRILAGKTPELITYAKFCKWLNSPLDKYIK